MYAAQQHTLDIGGEGRGGGSGSGMLCSETCRPQDQDFASGKKLFFLPFSFSTLLAGLLLQIMDTPFATGWHESRGKGDDAEKQRSAAQRARVVARNAGSGLAGPSCRRFVCG